ncbi:CRISPR-associated helicase Cas3' [Rothia sp. 11254D007CT]
MKAHPYIWSKQNGLNQTYPLLAHLLDTAAVALALHDHWLRPGLQALLADELGKESKKIIQWIAGSHDVGKASPIFQAQPRFKNPEWEQIRKSISENEPACAFLDERTLADIARSGNRFLHRHEQIGAFTLSNGELTDRNDDASDFWFVLPALGHHGAFTFPDRGDNKVTRRRFQQALAAGWSDAQSDLLDILSESLGISPDNFPEEVSPTVIVLLSGLVILADRIASGTDWVTQNQELMNQGKLSLDKPAAWVELCTGRALQRIKDTVGLYHGWESTDAALSSILGDHSPRPLQQEALAAGEGIWNAMAPTGNGKTEAALLRHSLKDERLIFLLPTQATTNALMRRVQKAYKSTPNVASLAHGLSSIEDFYTRPITLFSDTCNGHDSGGLYPTEFVKSGAARLLAPVCVGTIDQPLMASIPMKWTHLRLLALANSHVVIDEIHTLDHYQSELLVPLLTWFGLTNTRVTFLSATFPQWQRDRFMQAYTGTNPEQKAIFPAVEAASSESPKPQQTVLSVPEYTIDFTFSEPDFTDLESTHIQWASEQRRSFPLARLGIICNTVKRAQAIAQELSNRGETVLLLHSRMTAEHRKRNAEILEKTIGAGGLGTSLTVVGTQAIEASLDIDLDLLSTDLCPAPSLIQRAGRVWRREDTSREQRIPGVPNLTIHVITPHDAESWMLKPYYAAELQRTWEFLQAHPQFSCPTMNQDFVDAAAVTLESILTSEDLDQFAENSAALRKGKDKSEKLASALNPLSTIKEFSDMTDKNFNDSDDGAFTRLINSDIRQVIVGGNPEQIPGAWEGSLENLLSLAAHNQQEIQKALRASLPIVVSKNNREYLNGLPSLSDSKTLLNRYYYMQVPEGNTYDHVLGFIGVSEE